MDPKIVRNIAPETSVGGKIRDRVRNEGGRVGGQEGGAEGKGRGERRFKKFSPGKGSVGSNSLEHDSPLLAKGRLHEDSKLLTIFKLLGKGRLLEDSKLLTIFGLGGERSE